MIGADKFIDNLNDEQKTRHATQRYQRGWSDVDMWNADSLIADIIVACCNHYIDNAVSTPWNLDKDQWNEILVEIRDGFGTRDNFGAVAPSKTAWELLQLHFRHFWD